MYTAASAVVGSCKLYKRYDSYYMYVIPFEFVSRAISLGPHATLSLITQCLAKEFPGKKSGNA